MLLAYTHTNILTNVQRIWFIMKKVVNVQRDPFLMKSQSSLPIQELKLPTLRSICPQLMDYRVDYYDEVNSIIVNYSEMVGKPFVIGFLLTFLDLTVPNVQ